MANSIAAYAGEVLKAVFWIFAVDGDNDREEKNVSQTPACLT
jgi:hypothetical protein